METAGATPQSPVSLPLANFLTALVWLIVLAFVLWVVFFGGHVPQPFRSRSCQGKGWKNAFPCARKQEIREFLTVFVRAFAFSDKEKLKFSPDDQILLVYRALYPSKWLPDALELETLAAEIESRYGLKLETVWTADLTLGQLFGHIQNAHRP